MLTKKFPSAQLDPSNQPQAGKLGNHILGEGDLCAVIIRGSHIEVTRPIIADIVEASAFALAGYLDSTRCTAVTLHVDVVLSSIVKKADKALAGRTLQIRTSSVAVSIACPRYEGGELGLSSATQWAPRSGRDMGKDRTVIVLEFDRDHGGV
jgi:hypothetical protein